MLDDLLGMMAELDEIIGTTPSLGKLVENVEDPRDPGGGLEIISIVNSILETLLVTVVHSERGSVDPTISSNTPRSRPPRERIHVLRDIGELERVKTPIVGTSKDDRLHGYLMHITFGPGRYKMWWKDLCAKCDMSSLVVRNVKLLSWCRTGGPRRMKTVPVRIKEKPYDRLYVVSCRDSRLIWHRKSSRTKFQVSRGIISPVRTQSPFGRDRMFPSLCKGNSTECATATEMLYGAHREERSYTHIGLHLHI
ncbi:hypothetical protein L1987_63850 [Smallanthus sonchifolius]|uniref:Uncharacterized protein n=1 Tax=Smallanthus sonchifolius TaxID=185202 RepID=A0ACB9CEF9_9ASTR|nr:hypothetical protein L1987_63850 [Smallanthus sonchifolius]